MMRWVLTRILSALILFCGVVYAVENDLYSAVIPVDSTSAAERSRAFREAFARVLIKLTGSREIIERPDISDLLDRADSLATEFGYVSLEGEEAGKGLQVQFSAKEVDQLLRSSRLPVWPAKRTNVLVWVVLESPGTQMRFVLPEENSDIYQVLDRAFKERAQPVMYPLYDLQDQLALPVEDAWGLDSDMISVAGQRYGTDTWLIIRCYQNSAGRWRLAWLLSSDGQQGLDNLEAADLGAGLKTVVNLIVDKVAATQAYIPSFDKGELLLTVDNVTNFNQYSRMMTIIKELSVVQSVDVGSLDKSSVQLVIELEGDESQFYDSLGMFSEFEVPKDRIAGESGRVKWQQ